MMRARDARRSAVWCRKSIMLRLSDRATPQASDQRASIPKQKIGPPTLCSEEMPLKRPHPMLLSNHAIRRTSRPGTKRARRSQCCRQPTRARASAPASPTSGIHRSERRYRIRSSTDWRRAGCCRSQASIVHCQLSWKIFVPKKLNALARLRAVLEIRRKSRMHK
jgi:hypothetical protein